MNYHCTPQAELKSLDRQFSFFKKYFVNCSEETITTINNGRRKFLRRPYLIISFDDGLRSNFDFAVPLLQKYEFSGWFFVSPEFAQKSSLDVLTEHRIFPKHIYSDERYCMNVNELQVLSENHIIGSHTMNHHRFTPFDLSRVLNTQISESKVLLERIVERDIRSFAWVGGETRHYTAKANLLIRNNYNFVFTTLVSAVYSKVNFTNVPRTNIESSFSKELFLFQICGILDLFYIFKRFKVNRVLKLN